MGLTGLRELIDFTDLMDFIEPTGLTELVTFTELTGLTGFTAFMGFTGSTDLMGLLGFVLIGTSRTSGSDIDPESRCSCRRRSFSSRRSATVGPLADAGAGVVATRPLDPSKGGLLYVVAESD